MNAGVGPKGPTPYFLSGGVAGAAAGAGCGAAGVKRKEATRASISRPQKAKFRSASSAVVPWPLQEMVQVRPGPGRPG